MSKLSNRIWYGTFHRHEDVHQPSWLPILAWIGFLALVAAWRLRLPFVETEALEIHRAILDSLTEGQIWGRQALVGSFEFPPFATLALFVARGLGGWLGLPPGHLLVAFSQVWALFYFLRLPATLRGRVASGLLVFFLLLFNRETRHILYQVDPNWAMVVPAACGLYHFVLWCRSQSLRDIILLGVNCGLLVFAGPAGFLLGLIMLAAAATRILAQARRSNLPSDECRGVNLLAWAPALYFVALIFLANWLIMRDPGFFMRRLLHNLAYAQDIAQTRQTLHPTAMLSWLTGGGMLVALLKMRDQKHRPWAAAVAGGLLALILLRGGLDAIEYYPAGAAALTIMLALAGLLIPAWSFADTHLPNRQHPAWLPVESCLLAMVMILGVLAPAEPVPEPEVYAPPPPHRLEILATIDRRTPQTRIMIHGLQTPARFLDLREERFVARLDFDSQTIRQYARDEDFFYLLVPPDNGRYYSPGHPLAEIHRAGQPWLVLETIWPGNWQLWRVLPESEQL